MLAFEEGEDAFLFVGELGADGDEIEGTAAVHAVHFLKFGELLGAGAAPGGPEIDENDFGGGIFAKGFETGGLDEIDLDGFGFDSFFLFGLAAFGRPLDGAAHGGADGCGDGLSGEKGVEGEAGVGDFGERLALAGVDAALILEFELAVEDENVRSGDGTVGVRRALGRAVVEIGEVEMAVGGADLHFVEGVADVGVAHFVEADGEGIVGLDGDEGDALILIIGGELFDAAFVELRGGAMVAGEDDGEEFGGAEIGERIGFAIDGGEVEVRGGGADGERRGIFGGAGGEGEECGEQAKWGGSKWFHQFHLNAVGERREGRIALRRKREEGLR